MALTLSRYIGQCILIQDDIKIKLVAAADGKASLSIEAPNDVSVDREEVRLLQEFKDAQTRIQVLERALQLSN